MLQKLPIVGVMGSGTQGSDALAIPLGQALAALGVHLLTGAGAGVMTTVSKGFSQTAPRAGRCIGIIPTIMDETGIFKAKPEYPNPYVEIPIYTPLGTYAGEGTDIISRNFINIMTANVVIALPGSGGTLNEINIARKYGKPLALLGPHALPGELMRLFPHFSKVEEAINWLHPYIKGNV